MNRMYAIALALGLTVLPVLPAAAETTPLEELVSRMADTPEEHQSVAAYFREKAEAARAEAESHRRMGKGYVGTKIRDKAEMQKHCDAIASAQDNVAKEYEALAKLHEAEAKGAKP